MFKVTYTAATPMAHFPRSVMFATKEEAEKFARARRALEAKTWKHPVIVEEVAA